MNAPETHDDFPMVAGKTPLTQRVGIGTLQSLQDRFAALGRMTVAIATTAGRLITRPTWGSRFSELIGDSPRGRAAFTEAIGDCLLTAEEAEPPSCHEGMSLYTSSIVHDGVQLAIIVVGTRTHDPPEAAAAATTAARYQIDAAELAREAAQLDPDRGGAPEDIHRFADMLAHIIAALYGQALRIDRQLADLSAIHKLSDLLAGTLDVQHILDLTVRQVVRAMPVKACAIRLLNEQTGELVLKAVHNLSPQYLQKGPVMLQDNAIDATAFAGEAVYIEDAPNDPRSRYPEMARREGIVSGLCVPMTYRGETVGVIRVYTQDRYLFNQSEESLLRSIGSQAASAIINSRLYEAQAGAERVHRQVQAAAQIQRRMLPAGPPRHTHLDFAFVYEPTLQVGGDLLDFIHLPDEQIGFCIADVVGKGLAAALMMASIRAYLRAYALAGHAPDRAVAAVNRQLHRDTPVGEFATLVYAVCTADARTLVYCNAGHPPPVILRGDALLELAEGGMVIGVREQEGYHLGVVSLLPGDLLVMYTDGVTEAMNFQHDVYGRERLLASIRQHRALTAHQVSRQILWDVRRFAGLAEQSDDITILVVKCT
ncbi:MAG: SpoIIE family protein phosphatase [Planctomycetes bacterium]|nr:SpoIIE family protein phosphatase [Planctomycetota bacterium]